MFVFVFVLLLPTRQREDVDVALRIGEVPVGLRHPLEVPGGARPRLCRTSARATDPHQPDRRTVESVW